jgi:hypothetical protein
MPPAQNDNAATGLLDGFSIFGFANQKSARMSLITPSV